MPQSDYLEIRSFIIDKYFNRSVKNFQIIGCHLISIQFLKEVSYTLTYSIKGGENYILIEKLHPILKSRKIKENLHTFWQVHRETPSKTGYFIQSSAWVWFD